MHCTLICIFLFSLGTSVSHVFSSIQTYLVTVTLNNKFQRKQAAQQVCVQDNIEGECIASSFQRSHTVLKLKWRKFIILAIL